MANIMRTYYFYQLIDVNGLVYIGKTFNISKRKYDHFNRFLNTGVRETSRSYLLERNNLQFSVLGEIECLPYISNIEEDRLIQLAKEIHGEENVVNKNIQFLDGDYICTLCHKNYRHLQSYNFHECPNRIGYMARLDNIIDRLI